MFIRTVSFLLLVSITRFVAAVDPAQAMKTYQKKMDRADNQNVSDLNDLARQATADEMQAEAERRAQANGTKVSIELSKMAQEQAIANKNATNQQSDFFARLHNATPKQREQITNALRPTLAAIQTLTKQQAEIAAKLAELEHKKIELATKILDGKP